MPQLNHLSWFDRRDAMRDVQIHIRSPNDLVQVSRYIAALPRTLQNLELAFPVKEWFKDDGEQTRTITASYDLGHLKELRSLHLRGMSHPAAVLHLLSSTKSPHLRKVTIDVAFTSLRSVCPADYAPHDACLSDAKFEGVTEVCLLYTEHLALSRVTQKLRKVFPSLAARGILQVVKNQNPRDACLSL